MNRSLECENVGGGPVHRASIEESDIYRFLPVLFFPLAAIAFAAALAVIVHRDGSRDDVEAARTIPWANETDVER